MDTSSTPAPDADVERVPAPAPADASRTRRQVLTATAAASALAVLATPGLASARTVVVAGPGGPTARPAPDRRDGADRTTRCDRRHRRIGNIRWGWACSRNRRNRRGWSARHGRHGRPERPDGTQHGVDRAVNAVVRKHRICIAVGLLREQPGAGLPNGVSGDRRIRVGQRHVLCADRERAVPGNRRAAVGLAHAVC